MNGRGRGEKERGVRREGGRDGRGEKERDGGEGGKREEKQRHNEKMDYTRQAETDRQTGRQEA